MAENIPNRTKEQIEADIAATEERSRQRDLEDARLMEEIRQAREALAAIGEEVGGVNHENENTPSEKKPGGWKGKLLKYGLVGVLAGGGFWGAKTALDHKGQKEKNIPPKKEQIKKPTPERTGIKTNIPDVVSIPVSTNMTKLAEEIKQKPAMPEKTDEQVAQEKSVPITLEVVEAKLRRGEKITADEAFVHNSALSAEMANPRRVPMGGYISSAPGPGMNYGQGVRRDRPVAIEGNYFNLPLATLDKVGEVHDNNLTKIFPDASKAEKIWKKVKDKKAYATMSPKGKIPEDQKLLVSYLKGLNEKTGLSPKLNETVQSYINRALQKAAEDDKLDAVTLK